MDVLPTIMAHDKRMDRNCRSFINDQSFRNLTSVRVPETIPSNSVPLELSEEGNFSTLTSRRFKTLTLETAVLIRKQDWNTLHIFIIRLFQKKQSSLESGELALLYEIIRNIQNTQAVCFIFDYFKKQLLTKGMIILREDIRQNIVGGNLLKLMEETWEDFFNKILPLLDACMVHVKTREHVTIRQTALISFRDLVVLKLDTAGAISSATDVIPHGIKHMLLILQNVKDQYPPCKNKLKLESLVAKVVTPFLGFTGLYYDGEGPVVLSKEPQLVTRQRLSDGGRRISRPFSLQPKQLETLNEMFLSALCKQKDDKDHRTKTHSCCFINK
ncbi:proline-rich protein 5-like isoform X2 [Tachypleus tridentatus]|uniref:proline-rich protein 5-like isoform X2 n=1 Tax=Tachypleus tridentatus TaxID=6853 RepID=UPI003FD2578B